MHLGGAWGGGPLAFKGTQGEVPDRREPRTAPPAINIPNYKGHGGIFGDFLHCVKTRERPFRDIEIAHRTVATCHLANIVFWTGRGLKFDPVKEQVVGDEETNRWIDRPKRAPGCYDLPAVRNGRAFPCDYGSYHFTPCEEIHHSKRSL